MKLKLITIFFLSVYAIDIFAQAAKTIPNRSLDGDLKLQVNDGGVKTDALTITGSSGDTSLSGSLTVPDSNVVNTDNTNLKIQSTNANSKARLQLENDSVTYDIELDDIDAAGDSIYFRRNSGATPEFMIDMNGRIGVNQSLPAGRFHIQQVEADSNDDGIILDAAGEGSLRMYLQGGLFKIAKSSIDALSISNTQQINLGAAHRGFSVNTNDAVVNNGATLTVATNGIAAPGVTGFVMVEAARTAGAQNSNGTFWFFNSRSGSSNTINISNMGLGSGCTHTFSVGGTNEVIITNTSGVQCFINASVVYLSGY